MPKFDPGGKQWKCGAALGQYFKAAFYLLAQVNVVFVEKSLFLIVLQSTPYFVTVCCNAHVGKGGTDYLVPPVLLLLHSKHRIDIVFQELIRQLAQTGMVLRKRNQSLKPFLPLRSLSPPGVRYWYLHFTLSQTAEEHIFQNVGELFL